MAEYDPSERTPLNSPGFQERDDPEASVHYDRTRHTIKVNPGGAVRVPVTGENALPEVDVEGSGEEELLLAGPAGSSTKRARRSKLSSLSLTDKENLITAGEGSN